jgi:hypothetical protein
MRGVDGVALGACEIRLGQVAAHEARPLQIRAVKIRAGQVCALEVRPSRPAAPKARLLQIQSDEQGVIQEAVLEIRAPGGEQRPFFPIGIAPVDAHQAAAHEAGLLEVCLGQLDQAQVTVFKSAVFEAALAPHAFRKMAVIKGTTLKKDSLHLSGEVVDVLEGSFRIGGQVKRGHGFPSSGFIASKSWLSKNNLFRLRCAHPAG